MMGESGRPPVGTVRDQVLLLPCSGASHHGQVANRAAVVMDEAGVGKMYCTSSVAAGVQIRVKRAGAAACRVALDGCSVACARTALRAHGLEPEIHVVVADLGLLNSRVLEVADEDVQAVVEVVCQGLEQRGLLPAASKPDQASTIGR